MQSQITTQNSCNEPSPTDAGLPQGWTDPRPKAVVDELGTIYDWINVKEPDSDCFSRTIELTC